jgi:hypothetical protein
MLKKQPHFFNTWSRFRGENRRETTGERAREKGVISEMRVHFSEIINLADFFGNGNTRAHGSKLPPERSVLEARKERVQLGQRGALGGFQLFHGGHAVGEFALEVEGGDGNRNRT